jgi:hypothetical protein
MRRDRSTPGSRAFGIELACSNPCTYDRPNTEIRRKGRPSRSHAGLVGCISWGATCRHQDETRGIAITTVHNSSPALAAKTIAASNTLPYRSRGCCDDGWSPLTRMVIAIGTEIAPRRPEARNGLKRLVSDSKARTRSPKPRLAMPGAAKIVTTTACRDAKAGAGGSRGAKASSRKKVGCRAHIWGRVGTVAL